jgi:hypothetical protein
MLLGQEEKKMAKAQRIRTEGYLENDRIPTRIIAQDDIAQRAYALYLARGGEDGHDVDDWLAAELELREGLSYTQAQGARENVLSQRFGTVAAGR